MRTRNRSWISLVAATCLVAASCSDSSSDSGAKDDNGTKPPDPGIAVTVAAGAVAKVEGAEIQIPAGAVTAAAKLTVESAPNATKVGGHVRVVRTVDVQIDKPLKKPATVAFELPKGVDEKTEIPIVLSRDDTGSGWVWYPTAPSKRPGWVEAAVPHFSLTALGLINVRDWIKDRAVDVGRFLTGRAGVAQPSCGDEDAAREDLSITSDGSDAVKWCVGVENGRTIVRIANNRRTFVQIATPDAWKVVGRGGGVSVDALIRNIADAGEEWVVGAGREIRIVRGGDTISYEVPEGTGGNAKVELSFVAWALSGVAFGVEIYFEVAKAAGAGVANGDVAERTLANFGADLSGDLKDATLTCTKALSDNLTDDPYSSDSLKDIAVDLLGYVWDCVPSLADALGKTMGVRVAGFLVSVVGGLVSTILTGLSLVIAGVREIYDSFASFGGDSDTIYDIRLTSLSQPTVDRTGDGEYTMMFMHPTWGRVRLITRQPTDDETAPGPVSITVIDESGATKYSWQADNWYRLRPAGRNEANGLGSDITTPFDSAGHIFIDFDPGERNGVIVLRPIADGFETFGSLDPGGGYNTRFHAEGSFAFDENNDGTYEIRVDETDCQPSCAGATLISTIYDWTGTDYTERALPAIDPSAELSQFLSVWHSGDRSGELEYASDAVVDAFNAQFEPSNFDAPEDVRGCTIEQRRGQCDLLLLPASGGFALIVSTRYHQDESGGFVIDSLIFGGDAG